MTETTSRSIARKLAIAAKACGYVQKDGTNNFHRYRFASAANILGHVNDALCDAGLAVVDTLPEIVLNEGAGKERIVTVRMTIVVADDESGERATFRGLGSGMDAGDKAVMKAVTAATKYAWLGAFSISTGDDPESDEETDRRTAKPVPRRADDGTLRIEDGVAARTTGRSASRTASPRVVIAHVSAPPVDPEREAIEQETPAEVPAVLEDFYARVAEIELPGEAVPVWMKYRGDLAALPAPHGAHAWAAICKRTEEVGKMKKAHVWLAKAVKEEDGRRGVTQVAQS